MSLSGSPFARIKKPLKSEMNVVPYIDVMLVLLVIFMVTAPMLTAGLTVDLPKAPTDPLAATQTPPAIVSIKPDGQLYLKDGSHGDKDFAVNQDELRSQLLQAQSKNPKFAVLINGDEKVPYGQVVTLMATLQSIGLTQVGLLTELPGTAKH
jgi:biopolymer transport protein TolR